MTGRPTIFDQDCFDEILERHSEGHTIRSILLSGPLEDGPNAGKRFPSRRTLYNWLEDATLSAHFAHARLVAEDTLGDEVLDISRTTEEGYEDELAFKEIPGPEPGDPVSNELAVVKRKRQDMLGHRKFKAWAILQILARWNPGKWGARMNVEHEGLDNLADSIRQARERASQED